MLVPVGACRTLSFIFFRELGSGCQGLSLFFENMAADAKDSLSLSRCALKFCIYVFNKQLKSWQ